MTNGLFGLVVFLFAIGTLGVSALIYCVSVTGDVFLDVPAYKTAGVLGVLSVSAFLGWGLLKEIGVFPELLVVMSALIGVLVLLPIIVSSSILYVLRDVRVRTAARYAIASWAPSTGTSLLVIGLLANQYGTTMLTYVAAAVVLVLVSGVTVVGLFDTFRTT